jgi:transposase
MSETFSKVEVITGVARRRRFTIAQKLAIIAETTQPGVSMSYVARRHGLSPSLVFRWRSLMSEGGREAVRADDEVVPASEARRLEEKVRELERLLGRKTMEVEKGSARSGTLKKTDLAVELCRFGRFQMKPVTDTLGVARSNVAVRMKAWAGQARPPEPRRGR